MTKTLLPVDMWNMSRLEACLRRKDMSREQATRSIEAYRNFIHLVVKYPTERFGMSREIDQVWHEHILDTREYFAFCEAVVGRYLHHIPCFSESESKLFTVEHTVRRLKQEEMPVDFWEAPESSLSYCGGSIEFQIAESSSYCGGGKEEDEDKPKAPVSITLRGLSRMEVH